MSKKEGRVILTFQEALTMLPESDTVHTFINGVAGIMIGADWSIADVMDALQDSIQIELAGETATSMGHGLCFWQGPANNGTWVFVETKEAVKND